MAPSTPSGLNVTDALFALFRNEPRVPEVTGESLAHAWRCLLNNPEQHSRLAGATHLRIAYAHPQGGLQQADVRLQKQRGTTRMFMAAMDTCLALGRGESKARAVYALFMRMSWLLTEQHADQPPESDPLERAPLRCSRERIAAAARQPLRLNYCTEDGTPFDPAHGPARH